jgi:hypothetical protein
VLNFLIVDEKKDFNMTDKPELEVVRTEISLPEIPSDLVISLIQEAATALMQRWFPGRLPTGEDFERWTEIALADASAVIAHFMERGIIVEAEFNDR